MSTIHNGARIGHQPTSGELGQQDMVQRCRTCYLFSTRRSHRFIQGWLQGKIAEISVLEEHRYPCTCALGACAPSFSLPMLIQVWSSLVQSILVMWHEYEQNHSFFSSFLKCGSTGETVWGARSARCFLKNCGFQRKKALIQSTVTQIIIDFF